MKGEDIYAIPWESQGENQIELAVVTLLVEVRVNSCQKTVVPIHTRVLPGRLDKNASSLTQTA